jgi:hypothetical protein
MIVNTDKIKFMIIKSNKITYGDFVYEKHILEDVPSYKYLGIYIHHKINWNYSIEKRINGGGNLIMGLKIIVNQKTFGYGIIKISTLRL